MAFDNRSSFLAELEEELEEEYPLSAVGTAEPESLWEQTPGTPVCPGRVRETVSRFRRYSNSVTSIPQDQRDKIKGIAARIVASFRPGCQPLPRVRLTGHADRDVARERRQPGFELAISRERAL